MVAMSVRKGVQPPRNHQHSRTVWAAAKLVGKIPMGSGNQRTGCVGPHKLRIYIAPQTRDNRSTSDFKVPTQNCGVTRPLPLPPMDS